MAGRVRRRANCLLRDFTHPRWASPIQRYVQAGLITPDLRLPSGRYRWDVDRLREQINSLPVARDDE